jgi:oligosaccharide reducing-end xylanase
MNAVATLATTSAVSSQAAALVEDFWSTPLPTGMYRYYDGLLYTFALLHLSGEYAIYAPR